MFKTLLKYLFIGFLIWFILTKTGLKFKSENDDGAQAAASLPKAQYALDCYQMLNTSNFDKAAFCYKRALIGNAANPEIRYYLAVSMYFDKNFDGAKFHSKFIIDNLPKSPYMPFARKVFNLSGDALNNINTLETGSGSDYLADLDGTAPWRKMPIKVWIQHSDNNSNLRRAFNIWQTALYPTISFKMVSNKDDGNILVIFDDPAIQCSSDSAVGCTSSYRWNNDPKHTAGAVIRLTSRYPNGTKISDNQLFAVLSHEIGHALGMQGHSKNRDDIMYPDTSNFNVRPSKRDISTIQKMYAK